MIARVFICLLVVGSVAQAQTLSLTGGTTNVALGTNDTEIANLTAAGLSVVGVGGETILSTLLPGGVAFPIDPASSFLFTEGTVAPVSGTIGHFGTVTVNQTGLQNLGDVTLGNFDIGFDDTRVNAMTGASGFFVADTVSVGAPVFDLANLSAITATPFVFTVSADLLVSPELSAALAGDASLAGADVGNALVLASVPEPTSLAGAALLAVAGLAFARRRVM
jgi:hypothetical protein